MSFNPAFVIPSKRQRKKEQAAHPQDACSLFCPSSKNLKQELKKETQPGLDWTNCSASRMEEDDEIPRNGTLFCGIDEPTITLLIIW